jgi:ribosomal protein S6--L-glutamate ligase
MPTRVAILGDPAGWHVGRLRAALDERGHEAAVIRWNELSASVGGGDESFLPDAIDRADLVLVRGMPAGGLEEVILRMDVLGRIAARGTPVVNTARSLEIAIDKYLSLAVLARAEVPVPRTIVAQDEAGVARAWRALGGDCVYKPLFGSQGRGIERLSSPESLAPFVAAGGPPGGVVYLQEFVPHAGWDARVLLVGDRAFAMRRVSDGGDWRTNVARGARPERFDPPAPWIDLARRAAAAVGTEIAGVDLLPATDGRLLVLEVNAVPGWRALETVSGEAIARPVVRYLEERLRR